MATESQLIAQYGKIKNDINLTKKAIIRTSRELHAFEQQRNNAHLEDKERREVEKQYQDAKRRMKNLRTRMDKDLKQEKKIEDQIQRLGGHV